MQWVGRQVTVEGQTPPVLAPAPAARLTAPNHRAGGAGGAGAGAGRSSDVPPPLPKTRRPSGSYNANAE